MLSSELWALPQCNSQKQRHRTQGELTLCVDNVTEHKENLHFVHGGRDEGQDVVDGGTIKQVRDLAANTGLVA